MVGKDYITSAGPVSIKETHYFDFFIKLSNLFRLGPGFLSNDYKIYNINILKYYFKLKATANSYNSQLKTQLYFDVKVKYFLLYLQIFFRGFH